MYNFTHFLGYGVIVPEEELKCSPYRQEKLEKDYFEKNLIVRLDPYARSRDIFIGFLLDKDDDDFLAHMREAEKNIYRLYDDIFKAAIPGRYKVKMYAKRGNIWED